MPDRILRPHYRLRDRKRQPASSIWLSTDDFANRDDDLFSSSGRNGIEQCDCDCDCACVPGPEFYQGQVGWQAHGLLQLRNRRPSEILDEADGVLAETVDNYTAYIAPHQPGVIVVERDAVQRLLMSPRWLKGMRHFAALLVNLGVLVTRPAPQTLTTWKRETPVLAAWLHLTDSCNLACSYCYVRPGRQRMSLEMAASAVQAVFRAAQKHRFSQVKLKYAGGEPTLNFPALQAAQQQAESLRISNGIAFHSVVLTNGIGLGAAEVAYLAEHQIGVSLSLDGIDSVHDAQRPRRDGLPGSFDLTVQAIDRLKSAGIMPHISITLTSRNLSGLPVLIDYLLGQGLRFSFNFYRCQRTNTAQPDDLAPDPQRLVEAMQDAYARIERQLPPYSLLAGLVDRANLAAPHERACGKGVNYLVIDPQGGVTGCQMDLGQPISRIGVDDPLAAVQQYAGGFNNPSVDSRNCADVGCIWRYRCAGGCPRIAYQHAGNPVARSPLCEVYQALFPAALRLEALRLVRYIQPVFTAE